jgi:hypothetical protein
MGFLWPAVKCNSMEYVSEKILDFIAETALENRLIKIIRYILILHFNRYLKRGRPFLFVTWKKNIPKLREKYSRLGSGHQLKLLKLSNEE